MHIGYFSSILGTKGGPAIVDKHVLEAISVYDKSNQYTVYGLTKSATEGLNINNPNIKVKGANQATPMPTLPKLVTQSCIDNENPLIITIHPQKISR